MTYAAKVEAGLCVYCACRLHWITARRGQVSCVECRRIKRVKRKAQQVKHDGLRVVTFVSDGGRWRWRIVGGDLYASAADARSAVNRAIELLREEQRA